MEIKEYFISTRQNKNMRLLSDILLGTYVSFLYKCMISNNELNIPSPNITRQLQALKIRYNSFLNNPSIKNHLNDFQIRVFKNLLDVLENNLNRNISSYIKYDINNLMYYCEEYSTNDDEDFYIKKFILSFCNIYNLNSFDGNVFLPILLFDKNAIIITKFSKFLNISLDNSCLSNNNLNYNVPIEKTIKLYFLLFIETLLNKCFCLDDIVELGNSLFVEYSHISNFNTFLITEICRKIYNANFNYSILDKYNTSTIQPFIFKKRIIELIINGNIEFNLYAKKLLNLNFKENIQLKNRISIFDIKNQLNYFMNKEQEHKFALEAVDEDDIEETPEEETPEEETSNDPSTDDNLDEKDKESLKKNKKLIFKFELASEDESLEDILYKLKVYKILFSYLKKEDVKLSFAKETILKNWLTKWIFLLSANETRNLFKEFNIKI